MSAAEQCYWIIIVPPEHLGAFLHILENKLIGYADDSTLMAVVLFPGVRISVAECLNRDVGKLG